MVRGGVILVTALFSKVFLKKKLYLYHVMGCILVTVGITIVGSANFIFPVKDAETNIGFLMLIVISLFFNGIFYVSEEKIFSVYSADPLEVVGTEGLWGIAIYVIFLPIMSNVHCGFSESAGICISYYGNVTFESPSLYFHQFASSAGLAILIIIGVFTIAVFNVAGVNVTKHISSLARSLIDVTRTVLVWIVALIVTFSINPETNPTFRWENT